MSGGRHEPRAGFCPNCGALNGVDFNRCVRCGAAFSPRAASGGALEGPLDGSSLLGTKLIIGATLAVFALQLASAPGQWLALLLRGSPHDALRFGAMLVNEDAVAAEPWRLLSAIFVHYGILHLVMNMLGFANLGRTAEPMVGTARFIVAYLVTGIVGFAATVTYAHLYGESYGTTAGASGAVLGTMGLVLGWLLRRRDPQWKDVAVQAIFYGVIFGFAVNMSSMGVMVNNSAHIGGLVSGTLLGVLYAGGRRRTNLLANLCAAIFVVAALVSLILPHRSPLGRTRPVLTLNEAPAQGAPAPEAAEQAKPG